VSQHRKIPGSYLPVCSRYDTLIYLLLSSSSMTVWIKMPVGTEIGLGPGHIILDGYPASIPQKRQIITQFWAHVYCGQTAGWIKMILGTEVGIGPGDIVLDGDPSPHPPRKRGGGTATPMFLAHVYCRQTVVHLSNCRALFLKMSFLVKNNNTTLADASIELTKHRWRQCSTSLS